MVASLALVEASSAVWRSNVPLSRIEKRPVGS